MELEREYADTLEGTELSKAVVLKLHLASQSPRGCVETKYSSLMPRISDAGLRWGTEFAFVPSSRVAGPGITLGEVLVWSVGRFGGCKTKHWFGLGL